MKIKEFWCNWLTEWESTKEDEEEKRNRNHYSLLNQMIVMYDMKQKEISTHSRLDTVNWKEQ